MTGFVCPVEGCPFGEDEEKAKSSVKRHINAKGGDAHDDREALYQLLDDQEDAEEDVEEGETAEEQDESDDSEEFDTGESTDMPTDEEYEQQHSAGSSDDEPEEPEESDEGADEGSTDSSEDDGFSLPFPALDQRTVVLLVAVIGALFLVYVVMNRGDGESVQAAETSEEDAESGTRVVSNEEVTLIE